MLSPNFEARERVELYKLSNSNQDKLEPNHKEMSLMLQEVENFSELFKKESFNVKPLIHQIRVIVLTIFELSTNRALRPENFSFVLSSIYDYIKKWNETIETKPFYKKVLSEIFPIIDEYYITRKEQTNESIISILTSEIQKEAKNVYASLTYLDIDKKKLKEKCQKDYSDMIVYRLEVEYRNIEEKKESLHFLYLNELLNLIRSNQEEKEIEKSLINGKFDKKKHKTLSHSYILGSDEGIYVLLNTLSEAETKLLIRDSLINEEILYRFPDGKITIGDGSFGNIQIAMAIVTNKKNHTSLLGGDILCVKKLGRKKDQLKILESTWNDYCSINYLDNKPEIFDMKILKSWKGEQRGYCFQELYMLPNAKSFFDNEENQVWLHVKCYFLEILRLMINFHQRGICITDLKPTNILYDKMTKTIKIVNLTGILRDENLHSCKIKKIQEIINNYAAPELLEKFDNSDFDGVEIDLTNCISFTIGVMMEEIVKKIKNIDKNIEKEVISLYNGLTFPSPKERISLEEGLEMLKKIPPLDINPTCPFENYVNELKSLFDKKDSNILMKLNLKNDIYKLIHCFNDKLQIVSKNPEKFAYNFNESILIDDLLTQFDKIKTMQILQDKEERSKKAAILLLGSAGSGKSTILQKIFIQTVQSWKKEDPIPIFMNLAVEQDLRILWKRIMDFLSIKDIKFEDLIKVRIILFVDSLNESKMDVRLINKIFFSLSAYSNEYEIKMIIACRSGYFHEDYEKKKIKKNIQISIKYIVPLDKYFLKDVNFDEFLKLYLEKWEMKTMEEIEILMPQYTKAIENLRLKDMMNTTYMMLILFDLIPKLSTEEGIIKKESINLLRVYEMYIENNLQKEIRRSENELINKIDVSWFMRLGVVLAEHMMKGEQATNLLSKPEEVNQFFSHQIFKELNENYVKEQPLIQNLNIYNILRILNLNISFDKEALDEKITLSFPHDTIKNYFLTRGLIERIHGGDAFPDWISKRLCVDDQNLVGFMIEAYKNSSKLARTSEIAILSTKQLDHDNLIVRAANLITFLVASNYSFYGKDLSHIKIKGANVSDGIFNACNFDNADLSNVNLKNVKMNRASFRKTNLKNVVLDNYPYFEGHTGAVTSVYFSVDGKYVVSGSGDRTVRIWDVESGKQLKKLEGHTDWVTSVSFSADGKHIVSGSSDKTVRIWDVESGRELKKYKGHIDFVSCVSFSADGKKLVSGSGDRTIRIWDVESGTELKKYEGHTDFVNSVSFSADGRSLVSGSGDQTVRIWSVESEKEQRKYEGHTSSVTSVSFSVDGKNIISGSRDKTVRIWDVESGKELKKFEGHTDFVSSVSFSNNEQNVVSGSGDRTVRIWDIESGKELKKFEGHNNWVNSVSFSAERMNVVSGSSDRTVRIWNVESGKELKKYEGHTDWVTSVSFSKDKKNVVTGSGDQTVRIFDVESGKEIYKYEGHTGCVTSVSFSTDGKNLASGSDDKTIRIWDIESEMESSKYEGHSDCINSVSFSVDGKSVVSGSSDQTVRIWDVLSGKEVKKYEGHTDLVTSVSFSADGRFVVSGSGDQSVRIWDVESGKELRKYDGHTDWVTSVSFSGNGNNIVSGSGDQTVRVWDVDSGKQLKKYEGHTSFVSSVSFSSDGKYVVSGSRDKMIIVWEVESGKDLKIYKGHTDFVSSVSFSLDGKYVVSGSGDRTVRIWDAEMRIDKNEFGSDFTSYFSFSSDGKNAICVNPNKTHTIWDVESGKELKKYEDHISFVTSASFQTNENYLPNCSNRMENKNTRVIISSCATSFSCNNCYNYKESLNCSKRLNALFEQNDRSSKI